MFKLTKDLTHILVEVDEWKPVKNQSTNPNILCVNRIFLDEESTEACIFLHFRVWSNHCAELLKSGPSEFIKGESRNAYKDQLTWTVGEFTNLLKREERDGDVIFFMRSSQEMFNNQRNSVWGDKLHKSDWIQTSRDGRLFKTPALEGVVHTKEERVRFCNEMFQWLPANVHNDDMIWVFIKMDVGETTAKSTTSSIVAAFTGDGWLLTDCIGAKHRTAVAFTNRTKKTTRYFAKDVEMHIKIHDNQCIEILACGPSVYITQKPGPNEEEEYRLDVRYVVTYFVQKVSALYPRGGGYRALFATESSGLFDNKKFVVGSTDGNGEWIHVTAAKGAYVARAAENIYNGLFSSEAIEECTKRAVQLVIPNIFRGSNFWVHMSADFEHGSDSASDVSDEHRSDDSITPARARDNFVEELRMSYTKHRWIVTVKEYKMLFKSPKDHATFQNRVTTITAYVHSSTLVELINCSSTPKDGDNCRYDKECAAEHIAIKCSRIWGSDFAAGERFGGVRLFCRNVDIFNIAHHEQKWRCFSKRGIWLKRCLNHSFTSASSSSIADNEKEYLERYVSSDTLENLAGFSGNVWYFVAFQPFFWDEYDADSILSLCALRSTPTRVKAEESAVAKKPLKIITKKPGTVRGGKGGQGGRSTKDKSSTKRHTKAQIATGNLTHCASKSALWRIARRGGVKRLSALCYDEVRGYFKRFLEEITGDTIAFTEHGKRKTVTVDDVVNSLKGARMPIYGF